MRTYSQKTLFGSLFVLVALFPSITAASTIRFPNNIISVQQGETFTVPITVIPDGPAQYTMRFILQFPPQLLEATSFSFNTDWIPLPQKGYDLIDNAAGQIIKTGGVPGGFKNTATFGTITFRAKAAGEGLLTVGDNSFILNEQNKNTLALRPQISLLVNPTEVKLPDTGAIQIERINPAAQGTITPPQDLPAGEPSLFDVELGVTPPHGSPQWLVRTITLIGGILTLMLLFLVLQQFLKGRK